MGSILTHTDMQSINTGLILAVIALLLCRGEAKPWYQGAGLADCAPGKCPPTAEVSPVQCSSDPVLFFNNGFPRSVPRVRCAMKKQLQLEQEALAVLPSNLAGSEDDFQ